MEISEKMIAFQTVDVEGDIWCNYALLFKTEEDVENFFKTPKNVIDTLKYEVEENDDVENCMEIYRIAGEDDGSI